MEKRAIIAAILSAIFLSLYSQFVLKIKSPSPENRPNEIAKLTNRNDTENIDPETTSPPTYQFLKKEDTTFIESHDLKLEIGTASGTIRRAVLKQFHSGVDQKNTLEFGGTVPLIGIRIGGKPLRWRLVENKDDGVTLQSDRENQTHYKLSYILRQDNPVVDVELDVDSNLVPMANEEIAMTNAWIKGDNLGNRYNPLEAVFFISSSGGARYKRLFSPIRSKRSVPRGTSIFSLSERYFCQSVKLSNQDFIVQAVPSPTATVSTETNGIMTKLQNGNTGFQATIYMGPRDFFHLQKAGFAKAFKIGILGQIGLILVKCLEAIASVTKNYGIAIILLSMLVTCLMAPFTLLGFRSMKKMQELKPSLDKIMAQHKNDPKQANTEIFALYKQHKVSPISGCLPMFLQMPIFIALFQAISHFVGLRGAQFLWIHDLSLPDRIARLPLALPIIGSDINLLPVVMAFAMFFQTKISQKNMGDSNANPSAQMMSGPIMPILFGVMFYNFPAGLVLYWLTNSLMSLAWYQLAK